MFVNLMICSNHFLEAQSFDSHFSCKLLLTGTLATFNAAAWQFLLSSIWAWVIRTFRISDFEGCSGEPRPVSRRSGSALLMLCLTHVKTEHICRDVSNWHPPASVTVLPPHVVFKPCDERRYQNHARHPLICPHTFCITNTLLCVELRGMWRWAKELKLLFQQYRWSHAAKMMTQIHFPPWLWRFSVNRAKDQSEGNSRISHENGFHQFHFLNSFSAR